MLIMTEGVKKQKDGTTCVQHANKIPNIKSVNDQLPRQQRQLKDFYCSVTMLRELGLMSF